MFEFQFEFKKDSVTLIIVIVVDLFWVWAHDRFHVSLMGEKVAEYYQIFFPLVSTQGGRLCSFTSNPISLTTLHWLKWVSLS